MGEWVRGRRRGCTGGCPSVRGWVRRHFKGCTIRCMRGCMRLCVKGGRGECGIQNRPIYLAHESAIVFVSQMLVCARVKY